MASDNQASYTRIGFTIIIGVIALFAVLIYLGGISSDRDFFFAETYCEKSVSGLSVGSVVNFRGVKIGSVREISFVGSAYDLPVESPDAQLIRLVLAFDKRLIGGPEDKVGNRKGLEWLVNRGVRATVTASGITGLSRVEVDIYKDAEPVRKLPWNPKYVYIPAKASLMDSFSDSATKVMNHINKMDFSSAWSNVQVSVEAMARTTEQLKTMVETHQGDLQRMVEDMSEATASMKAITAELERNPSLLIRERIPSRLPETR